MDLIFTDANRVDQGVLSAYAFDLSFGAEENDFEMTVGRSEAVLEYGAFIYMEGTEYGGIVDTKKTHTNDDSITYMGRTWHGLLNSKVVQPDAGETHYIVSGDANTILSTLISRLGLDGLFVANAEASDVNISKYKFHRYCTAYDGIRDMLADNGGKLQIVWKDRAVYLSAVPIIDHTEAPVDGDIASLTVERHELKVNHLVCLGRGELADREIVHLYADQDGVIGENQYYTGLAEVADVYDNSNSDDLTSDGRKKLAELRNNDKAEIALNEDEERVYDIGDIVGASDVDSGVSVVATVSQKIVRINNGAVSIEYKTGS